MKIQRERASAAAIQLLNAAKDTDPVDNEYIELTMFGSLEEVEP